MSLNIDLFMESQNKPVKANKSKKKGNTFENKIAKQLGKWIFDDCDVFTRSITSGAIKHSAYLGDIVPQKQLQWKEFPFLIECKNGYKQNISNFNNTTLIDNWLLKCLKERSDKQPIIWLIIGFHSYEPLLLTDLELSMQSNIIIKETYRSKIIPFYIYRFKEIICHNFYDLYKHNSVINEVFVNV